MSLSFSVRSLVAAGVFSALSVAGLAIASTSPDAVVARSFAAALDDSTGTVVGTSIGTPVSGTEEFWLAEKRRLADGANVEPATWPDQSPLPSLSAGDRITIGAGNGRRTLEIVSVSGTDAGAMVIKARDTADAKATDVLTLTVSVAAAQKSAKNARAL